MHPLYPSFQLKVGQGDHVSTHHILVNVRSRAISPECLYPQSRACTLPNAFRYLLLFKSSLSATSLLQKTYISTVLLIKKIQRGFLLLQKKAKSKNSIQCLLCSELLLQASCTRAARGTTKLLPQNYTLHQAPIALNGL